MLSALRYYYSCCYYCYQLNNLKGGDSDLILLRRKLSPREGGVVPMDTKSSKEWEWKR